MDGFLTQLLTMLGYQLPELLACVAGVAMLLMWAPAAPGRPLALAGTGLMLAAAACYDPREAVPLWERMGAASGGQAPPEFSSTHPNPGTRIQNLTALMPKAMAYRQKFCPQGAAQ